jgi:Fe-S cluster assembly protein SufB
LNSAVFSDGSFCFIPKGVKCPMDLSTYFRINAAETGQFERTLVVRRGGARRSITSKAARRPCATRTNCTPRWWNWLRWTTRRINYSTVQNWYAGDEEGKGGIYNFVTKRGKCAGVNSHISWTQVETGLGDHVEVSELHCCMGDNSVGEFYSVAVSNKRQQADTGTKMIHLGKNTKSTIISKTISAGAGNNSYRGLVQVMPKAANARNYTQCDSLLIGDQCGAHTFPVYRSAQQHVGVEHEASTSKISEDQLFYCKQRGIGPEDAISMVINGFCKEVFDHLPMEFAVEATKLLGVSLEGSVVKGGVKAMLEVENLHATVEGNEILKGIDLRSTRARCTPSWARTARARARSRRCWRATTAYEVTEGTATFLGEGLARNARRRTRAAGLVHGVSVSRLRFRASRTRISCRRR